MKIRIQGSGYELNKFLQEIKRVFDITLLSRFYPDEKADSTEISTEIFSKGEIEKIKGRIYLEVKMKSNDSEVVLDGDGYNG